jgi:hypothetical protein
MYNLIFQVTVNALLIRNEDTAPRTNPRSLHQPTQLHRLVALLRSSEKYLIITVLHHVSGFNVPGVVEGMVIGLIECCDLFGSLPQQRFLSLSHRRCVKPSFVTF